MKKEIPMSKVNDYLEHMAKSRAKVLNKLQDVSDDSMTLPIPNRNNMYVRSMFYRFISHEVEHTIHLAKTLTSLGIHESEAKQILKELAESRGKLIGMISTLSDDELDSKLEELQTLKESNNQNFVNNQRLLKLNWAKVIFMNLAFNFLRKKKLKMLVVD